MASALGEHDYSSFASLRAPPDPEVPLIPMWHQPKPVLVAIVSVAALAAGAASADATAQDRVGAADGTGRPVDTAHDWDRSGTVGQLPGAHAIRGTSARAFTGLDGLIYETSPAIVPGTGGTFYFGEEMDSACAYGGVFNKRLRALGRLAKIIKRSGRGVVFTVAPNKSAVNKRDLDLNALPHGYCDLAGITAQDRALDRFKNPDFISMRRVLAEESQRGTPVYWRIDTHWTTISTSRYAQELAHRLDPRVAKMQSYRPGQQTILVDLSFLGILARTYETGQARFTTTKVKVVPTGGTPAYDPNVVLSGDHAWKTKPGKRTFPGRTALVGDSFTYRGLANLMPLFRHGRFVWIGQVSSEQIIDAIVQADTVVLEVVQRFLPVSLLVQPGFRTQLKRALAAAHR